MPLVGRDHVAGPAVKLIDREPGDDDERAAAQPEDSPVVEPGRIVLEVVAQPPELRNGVGLIRRQGDTDRREAGDDCGVVRLALEPERITGLQPDLEQQFNGLEKVLHGVNQPPGVYIGGEVSRCPGSQGMPRTVHHADVYRIVHDLGGRGRGFLHGKPPVLQKDRGIKLGPTNRSLELLRRRASAQDVQLESLVPLVR